MPAGVFLLGGLGRWKCLCWGGCGEGVCLSERRAESTVINREERLESR